jgi:anti-sigma factor RsiW
MDNDSNISPLQPDKDSRLQEDRLLAYLDGKLSPAEQHEVELWLADEGMESDALEGLEQMAASDRVRSIKKLNHQLTKTVIKRSRGRRKPKNDIYVLAAVFLILLLAAVAFLVIKYTHL